MALPVAIPVAEQRGARRSVGGVDAATALSGEFARTVGLDPGDVTFTGEATLASGYPVSDLAAASIGVAALAAARLEGRDAAVVRRELADAWFGPVCIPAGRGSSLPSPWDPIAGNYRTRDGWIRLHTNAPAHRSAALRALGLDPDPEGTDARNRDRVAAAAATWAAGELETAVVEADGAAGELRTPEEWAAHPQGSAVTAEPLVDRRPTGEGRAPRLGPPERPLRGIRVLDLTRVLAGPTATQLLAGLGADVLRIDPPGWDEPAVLPLVMSGKRSARVDLRTASGLALVRDLLADADVLIHGLRPGALDRLGLGEDERRRLRPGLVEVTLDAYGWTGPWAERRAFDSVVQLSSGIGAVGMVEGAGPVSLPVQALDVATGYLIGAAALAALDRASRTGRGEIARLSLARTAAELERTRSRIDAGELERAPVVAPPEEPREEIATAWGPLLRLEPPIGGLSWTRPPAPLGTDRAAWSSR